MTEQLSNVLRGNVLASTLKLQLRFREAIFRAGTEKGVVHNLSGEQSDAEPTSGTAEEVLMQFSVLFVLVGCSSSTSWSSSSVVRVASTFADVRDQLQTNV